MALEVQNIDRSFILNKGGKDIPLDDPNMDMSAEEVMKFYSGKYPELTNAVIEGPKVVGEKAQYTMTTKAGKLG